MKLYFQTRSGSKRVAINTARETWNDNYFYLGAHHTYIEVSNKDYVNIIREIDFNAWSYDEEF